MSTEVRPRISFSQFVRYWNADTSTKRRSVVRNLLVDSIPPSYYRDFQSAIQQYVRNNQTNDSILVQTINSLRNSQPSEADNSYEYKRVENNIDILQSAMNMIPFSLPVDFSLCTKKNYPKLLLPDTNLDISVSPDFVYRYTYRNRVCVGAIKLFYVKEDLNEICADLLATLLREFLIQQYATIGSVRVQQCRVIDLNTGIDTPAPMANQRRIEQISEDCRAIYDTLQRL